MKLTRSAIFELVDFSSEAISFSLKLAACAASRLLVNSLLLIELVAQLCTSRLIYRSAA